MQGPLFVNVRHPLAVPDIAEVAFLAAVREQPGPERGRAFAALPADAVIDDAVLALLAQNARQMPPGGVALAIWYLIERAVLSAISACSSAAMIFGAG